MFLYGDIHGDWAWMLKALAKQPKHDPSALQLGDFGIGFPSKGKYANEDGLSYPPDLPATFRFLRGNHDNPDLCRDHPNYLGDYGYDEDLNLFYISGAFSIDKEYRIPGIDWWSNEELSWHELDNMLQFFVESKPKIVVSHDCPCELSKIMYWAFLKKGMTRTGAALQMAFENHQPEHWLFGHHHISKTMTIDKTKFSCVGERQRYELRAWPGR